MVKETLSEDDIILRDNFAMTAFSSIYATVDNLKSSDYKIMSEKLGADNSKQLIARMCYAMADEMLEVRKE